MNTQNTNQPLFNSVALLSEIKAINKEQVSDIVREIYMQVDEGQINPITLKTKFKVFKEIIERLEPLIQEHCINEALKLKGQDFNNCKIEVRNSGNRLNYDDDSIYKEIKGALKQREELLKLAYKQRGTIIFDEFGVEVPVVSSTAGKDNVYITLK